jgi:uncharacterized protein YigA (DUF484 family)
VDPELTEEAVHEFLQTRPDFFEKHASLLGKLRLPHVAGGAVSLIERQVSVLRQKNLKLERKLKELIQVARGNDALSGKIHLFSLQLMSATDFPRTLATIEESLRTIFNIDQSVLVLFGDPSDFDGSMSGRFLRVIDRKDAALKPFATFLGGRAPRCGQVRDAQRDFLFGSDTNEIGSVALVPMGDGSEYGFLAIGSADANRFHPGMSIDYLTRIGELASRALTRY